MPHAGMDKTNSQTGEYYSASFEWNPPSVPPLTFLISHLYSRLSFEYFMNLKEVVRAESIYLGTGSH